MKWQGFLKMKNKIGLTVALVGSVFLILKFMWKGGVEMDVVYATLIIHGKRTFAQVPMNLKERTKKCLEDLGMGELAKEEA